MADVIDNEFKEDQTHQHYTSTLNESPKMTDVIDTEYKEGLDFFPLLGLYLISAVIPILFLLGFSGMGYGLEVTANSQEYLDETTIEIEVVLALLVIMYIFDEQYWITPLRIVAWSTIVAAIFVTLCLLAAVIPYGPICVFTVAVPLSIFGIRILFFPNVPANVLVGWNYRVYLYMASIILVTFFYWCIVNGNKWDSQKNAEYSQKAGCAVDFTNLGECENYSAKGVPCFYDQYFQFINFSNMCSTRCLDVYQACQEAFIIWSFPNLAAMSLFVIGFISKYLENPSDPNKNYHISALAKFCVIVLFLFWIVASLAGAGEGLSSSLIALAISMLIGSTIVFSVVSWKSIVQKRDINSLVASGRDSFVDGVQKQVGSYIDPVRGLVVLAFSPFIIVYLPFSMLNQFIRRLITRHYCPMPRPEYEHNGYFTLAVTAQIDNFLSWDHAKVLSYAVYWGVAYVFLNVLVSKFTTVFLSELIQYTSGMNLFVVTGIVVVVGMIMFMLPPIPGVPVYITSGIVLVSVGRYTLGLWSAISYACIVSLILKLFACAIQQQIIGGTLGGSVRVRQLVAINSEGIRAMRVIFSDKGMTKRKVAVLVGGPDWPVSVLCGILGQNLFPILIGTIPVFLLIVPMVLAGAFAFLGSVEGDNGLDVYPWADTMGAVASTIAAGFLLFLSVSAAGAIKDTLEQEKDTIDAIPIDEDVRKADEESARKQIFYSRVTVWSSVPFVMKFILITSLLAMMGCCYLLVIFNSQCFSEYDLMYTIKEHLGGNWTNIVLPLGRVSLILFAVSYALLFTFELWATSKADEMQHDGSGITETLNSANVLIA